MSRACARCRSLLPEALEGALDEALAREALAHARACPTCRPELEFYRRLLAERAERPPDVLPAIYYDGVWAGIESALPRFPRPSLPVWRPRLARVQVANGLASAVLLLAALLLAGGPAVRPGPAGSPEPAARIASANPPRLVAIEGVGLVSSTSPILKMTPRERAELGLRPWRVAALTERKPHAPQAG